jgi:hypothetical protein
MGAAASLHCTGGQAAGGGGMNADHRLELITETVNRLSDDRRESDPAEWVIEVDAAKDYERLMDAPALLVGPGGGLIANHSTGE